MTKQEQKLKAILDTKAFHELQPYNDPNIWEGLNPNERELLALLFVKHGEHQLSLGDSKVLESFATAQKIAPGSAVVHFQQALAFSHHDQNIRCLESAAKSLEKALHIDQTFIAGWHCFGFVLVKKGVFYNDIDYFYEADKKFHEAEHLQRVNGGTLTDTFYWHWGISWYNIGRLSGEAVDYFRALEKFRMAEKSGCDCAEFNFEYANLLVELGALVESSHDLYTDAVQYYKKSVKASPNKYESWFNLGCCLLRLYDNTATVDYFREADEVFSHCSELSHDDPLLWLRWGELLVNSAKSSRDLDKIQASFEKFQIALSFEPDDPYVLLRWGEAEMLMGAYTEELEPLQDARAKIARSVEMLPHEADAWYIYGVCMSELGRYFSAPEYYHSAIEKFDRGLKIKTRHPLLLHGIAQANFALGEMNLDIELIKKAVDYCAKAAETQTIMVPQFYNDWGVALMKLGEMTNDQDAIEAAAEKFEKAISRRLDVHAEDVELEWLYNYGCAMDFLGDFHEEPVYYEKAIQVLSHILQIDPEYHHARYNLALAYYHLGELNSDIDTLHQSMDLFHGLILHDPEDEMAWNDYGMTILSLAVLTNDPIHAYESHKLFEQAEAKFQQAIALGNVNTYYNIGSLYALNGNHSAAIHYLERAEESDALPSLDAVMQDEWLESLRHHAGFRQLISRLLNKEVDTYDE